MSQSKKWFIVVSNKRRQHFKTIFLQLIWHPLIQLFYFSNLLQTAVEWSTLSSLATPWVLVRGSASMMALTWLLSTWGGRPRCSLSSRLSSPLQNFLNHHLYCIFISSSWAKFIVVSCLHCFMTHFELEFKNCSNLPFV